MRVFVYQVTLDTHRDFFNFYLGGDFHYGIPECDEKSMSRFIKTVEMDKKRRYTALMGDYVYSFPKQDIRNWGSKPKHGDVLNIYTELRDAFRPIAPSVVCCLAGNHDEDWIKSENIDFVNWMCAELNMPYGGYESYIRFKVKIRGDVGSRRNVDVLLWHGAGGGRTAGNAFNKLKNPIDSFRTPDVVAMGHLHRLGLLHEQYLTIDEDKLDVVSTDQYFVLTGGYQKGFQPPDSTYISRKMLPPICIGGVKLKIQPFRDVGNRDVLDIQFSEVR